MKLAISGKGGVGKTTFAAILARLYARDGKKVLAVDADPDANLASALGCPNASTIVPIRQMKALILERTGAKDTEFSAFFRLNPHVSDLPDQLSVEQDGVRLLVLGAVHRGGGGCACPENAFLRALMSQIILYRDEVVIADMEAGVEHLGRATVEGVDALIVVVEPGQWSISTAFAVRKLAQDIGIRRVLAVGNKVRSTAHVDFLKSALGEIPLLGTISYNEKLAQAGLDGTTVFEAAPEAVEAVREIKRKIEELCVDEKNVKRKA